MTIQKIPKKLAELSIFLLVEAIVQEFFAELKVVKAQSISKILRFVFANISVFVIERDFIIKQAQNLCIAA